MKRLYPAQQRALDFLIEAQTQGFNTLDASEVGLGKTVVAAHLVRALGMPVAVLCPKICIPSWERELAEVGAEVVFIKNYEAARNGNTEWLDKRGKKTVAWNIPEGTLVVLDEVHGCKGPFTLNAQLFIKLCDQGYKVHSASATAAKDPTEMRPLGYALGLHSLNAPDRVAGLASWFTWMRRHGCKQDHFKKWVVDDEGYLPVIHDLMFTSTTVRLTTADLPDAFKGNHIIEETVRFADAKKIAKAYDDYGITPEIVERFIENNEFLDDEDEVMVRILRARQLAESFKVPDLVSMTEELLDQGKSVVLFVNFTDTLTGISAGLGKKKISHSIVRGGQSGEDREAEVQAFQTNRRRVIILNAQAGGTGVSLHDTDGNFPRVSLLCPTFNEKTHHQMLGRCHRNGGQSDVLQKVLIAEGSIEDAVIASVNKKLGQMHKLLNG